MNRIFFLLFLTAGLCSLFANNRHSFNADWKFSKGKQSNAQSVEFDDSHWRSLDLPHDWAIEGPFKEEYGARTGGLPTYGTGWYRKTFAMPEKTKGKIVTVEFDGAMYNAEVWLNGHKVGYRPYGYIGFICDLTPHLKFGSKKNVLAVRLTPEELSSRWYPGAGIYRNVWLEINHPVHVGHWGTFITTPEISAKEARVNVLVEIENSSTSKQNIELETVILNPNGKKAAVFSTEHKAMPGMSELTETVTVENPRLWDIDSPNLYKAVTQIKIDNKIVDEYETLFGIRTIEYSADGGFQLNGKHVRMQGVCMHHDLGPLGAAVNRRATERQLEIMKSMGVNAIRTSHNPPSPEQLEFCDKLGLVVQVEAFDCWEMPKVPNGYNKYFKEWHDRDLRDMIRRDRNHPSVVMWSIGNEILEQGKADGWKLARKLTAICKEEDTTRPISAGFNYYPASVKNGLAAEIDIVGLNYHPASYENLLNQHPDWIVLGSETSSCVSSRGTFHLPIEMYKKHESLEITSYDIIGPPWAYPPDIEFYYLEKNPNVIGEFVWTGFDYLGEPTPFGGRDNSTDGRWSGDWPVHSSFFGTVDLCGIPKDRFYLYQSQWTDEPMIHLLPHWNWQGKEGEKIPVFAFTNCDEAELFVNGKSFSKRVKGVDTTPLPVDLYNWPGGDLDSKYRLRWNVPYQPGSIKVVGYKNGKAITEKEIKTAGEPARIALTADRHKIDADGKDLSFITVKIEDKDGNLCPHADNQIRFTVSGAGEIKAVGNGNPASTESFQADHIKAFNGMCMLIVKSNAAYKGAVHITAKAENLQAAKTRIHSKIVSNLKE